MVFFNFGARRSPSSEESVNLFPELPRLPSSDLQVWIAPECGSSGGCPTIYQVGRDGRVIVQGYPPLRFEIFNLPLQAGEEAVMIPATFFDKVLAGVCLMLPIDWPDGDSFRLIQKATGDVIIRGVPVPEGSLNGLKVPPGELAIAVELQSFWKMIANFISPVPGS
jgi:hypothetical protein